ncbi:unnamed protein product [Clavelina lepadiformis]|uniref:Uncharacterized protein n=1 Tax=Clavelina lepadiformis TaxID=159417 RepID=A0ABP0F3Q9_CLALP
MTSCALPSSVTTSRLWSFERDQDLTSDECGWPKEFTGNRIVKRSRTLSDEDAGKKLLDFDQLEKDIIKHVLADDDNSHSEAVDVFPSFNYAPFPFPKNFLKSNPILKLYPRDPGTFVGSVETKTEKFLQPTQILPKISLRTRKPARMLSIIKFEKRMNAIECIFVPPPSQERNLQAVLSANATLFRHKPFLFYLV